MDRVEERLGQLGLVLPPAPAALANYVPFLVVGNLLAISGQVSRTVDGRIVSGRLGVDLSIAEGQAAAQLSALAILAQMKAALGGFDRVAQVMRLTGFVNASADFIDHPQVVNGASDLIANVLGERGRHTRSAVGCSGLPGNAAVEIDALVAIVPA